MSIRKRLVLSNIAMILIPVFLFIVAAMLLFNFFLGSVGLPWNPAGSTSNPDTRLVNDEFAQLRKTASLSPDRLDDRNYITQINRMLNSHHASLILRKNGRITFQSPGSKKLSSGYLPGFGAEPANPWPNLWISHRPFHVQSYDFYYPDGAAATLFIVRDAWADGGPGLTIFPILFLFLLLILIATNGLLTYFVSRSIIRPVKTMTRAAQKIGEGDLDFQIDTNKKDELGKLSRAFEVMRRKLKDSIEQQIRYEENRKEAIASISHDLKTPITSVKGYVEGIRDGVANTPKKMERYLNTIYTKSIDMDQLIDELALFSKLDMNRLPYHFEKVDLKAFLSDLIEEIRFDFENKGVSLIFHADEGSRYLILGDREKLKRVVINIVGNSIKYSDKDQMKVRINLSQSRDHVAVWIEDNGTGISREALPQIFDRFYRADRSRSSGTGGSGLGLAIVKRIIEDHGGEVWAESAVHEGTRICFTIKKFKTQKGDSE